MDTRQTVAHAATYLIWGATFLGVGIAVGSTPPLWMATLRFAIAAVCVAAVAMWRVRGPVMSWPRAFASGGLLFLATHGIVSTVQVHVPSGVAAVAMAAIPLWMALLGRRGAWGGIVVGFAGVVVLAWPSETVRPLDGLLLGLASFAWALGSLATRRWMPGHDAVASVARQGAAGAVLLGVASWLAGETWSVPTGPSLVAIVALAVGGSVAYFAYAYLLQVTTPGRASSYAYVNPVIAVLLGLAVGEPWTWRLAVATPMVVLAVYWTLRPQPSKPAAVCAPSQKGLLAE